MLEFERISKLVEAKSNVLIAALVVAAAVGGSAVTFAFLTDSDASTGNAVDSGSLDLALDGNVDGLSNTFSIANGMPADSVTHTYNLTNAGTTDADHLQFAFSVLENDPQAEPQDADLNVEQTAAETAAHIEVTTLVYTNPDGTTTTDFIASGTVTDANTNGIVDLADVQTAQASGTFDNLTPPSANSADKATLQTTFQIANDDGGSFTGDDENMMSDGVAITVDFTLNQDSSQ